MSSQLYWNMNQANPFSVDVPRVPPPPILGNLDREMLSSPSMPPDSTTRGRSLSGSSEVELSRCSACPSPGLVPPSAMVSHVVSCHRGQGFQCAACKHVGINTSLLGYEELKEHIRQAHKVTSEGLMPTAIILPSSLVHWKCKLCNGALVFLREDLAMDHIATVHGQFYMKKADVYCMATCRLCNFEGDGLAEHIASDHPRDDYADEEDEEREVPNLDTVDQDPDLGDRNLSELNCSVRSVNTSVGSVSLSIRSDLFPGDRAGPSVQRSLSPAEPRVKLSPKSRSSSPDIVFEKAVMGTKAGGSMDRNRNVKKENVKNEIVKKKCLKRKKRKESSSSSSGGSSSDSSDEEKEKIKRPKKWVTDVNKYLKTPPKVKQPSSSLANPRSPSSSPSPVVRKSSKPDMSNRKSPSSKPDQRKRKSPSASPEYQAPLSSPESPSHSNVRSKSSRPQNPQMPRSRARSPPKVYARESSNQGASHRNRSPPPLRDFAQSRIRIRSPRRRDSRTPPRRFSRTPPRRFSRTPTRGLGTSPRRFSRTPPRRFSRTPPRRFSKSPSTRNSRTPQRRQSSSPVRPQSRSSRSVSRQNNVEQSHDISKPSMRSPEGVLSRRRDDKVHCSVCNIDCDNSTQYNQHKLGQRHKQAAIKAGISPEPISFSVSSRPVATFGKVYCAVCKSASEGKHFHCDVCQVHSLSLTPHNQHIEGKKHLDNMKNVKGKGFMQIKSPIKFRNVAKTSAVVAFPNQKHCPSCDRVFSDLSELAYHVREDHRVFITCKECKALKHPAFEALTCVELVDHLKSDHYKTNISESDVKYYGEVPNWKQGYIKCKLCPPLKLGNIGLWFDNEVNTLKIRKHFQSYHSKHTFNATSYLTLGCQLCSTTLNSDKIPTWQSHLASHQAGQVPAEQESYNQGGKGGTTSTCSYCCTHVLPADEQEHVKSLHIQLAFSCKLCPVAARFAYKDYEDILRHLKLKHNGNNPHQNIIFPGDMKNLSNFAWVKCKTSGCEFTGLGLGKEVRQHLTAKHKGGGLQDFNIFCRICDKDERSIYNYDDAEDFVDHMENEHDDIVKHMPSKHAVHKDWLRGLDLGVGV